MNSLILSALMVIIALFHLAMNNFMRRGNVKTGFCTIWCIDAIFAVGGTVLSFMLYQYRFTPFLTVRNGVLVLIYLLLTVLFIWLAPSGLSLLTKKRPSAEEEILLAEYRLNDTLGMVRNCFMILLFVLPVLFAVAQGSLWFSYLGGWKEAEICGGVCFVAFLILVPVCLRQALFWLRNLTDTSLSGEEKLLKQYRMQLWYRHKNWLL